MFHLSKILNGHRPPGADLLDRLENVTGLDLSSKEETNG